MGKENRPSKAKKTKSDWLRDAAAAALIVITALGIIYLSNTLRGGSIEVVAEMITTTTTLGGGDTTMTTAPTTAPTTTTTTTTTTVSPTTTVEAEPVSCVILPENLCSQGVLVEWTSDWAGAEGGMVTITIPALAFELPPGTPIFAPADGEAFYQAMAGNDPSKLGFEGREVGFMAFFVRNLESPEIGNFWEPVREGGVLGLVSQFSATGGKGEVVPAGNYNLIVVPTAGTEMQKELRGQPVDRNDLERQLDLDRWFWEGWFGMEAQPFIIEP